MDKYEKARKFSVGARKFKDLCAEIGVEQHMMVYTIESPVDVTKTFCACIRHMAQIADATPYEIMQMLMADVELATTHEERDLYKNAHHADKPVYIHGPSYEKMAEIEGQDDRDNVISIANILFNEEIPPRITSDHPHYIHFHDE